MRRKIRLIEGNAKCRHLKRDFETGVYLSEVQNPIPLPLAHCIRVYSILIRTGKGGRVEPERRLEGQQIRKLGRNNMTDFISSR